MRDGEHWKQLSQAQEVGARLVWCRGHVMASPSTRKSALGKRQRFPQFT